MTKSLLLAGAVLAAATLAQPAFADPINVVAAENFYGDIAQQIGGDNVAVTSILSSPDQIPICSRQVPRRRRRWLAQRSSSSMALTMIPGWKSC
jgi:zinc/manganese transport system substrate-binding protein